jgi:excisionase family DNA binding protein
MKPLGLSYFDTGRTLGGDSKPLSRTTIWRLVKKGELRKLNVGSRSLIDVTSIEEYAARQLEAA